MKLFIIILTTLLVFIRAEDDLKGSSQSKEDKLIENIEEDLESQNQEAFDNMLNGLYPLTPEQILSIRDRYEDTLRAKQSTSMSPPKPTISSQFVKLSPGSTPPIVRLLEGFVSSVVFLDSTGAVWPIESYNVGDPNSFNLQWNGKDNIIVIQAKTLFKYGNLIVRLEGLDTPVVVTLIPGQKEVDYRRELRISGYGPNSNAGNNNQDATVENRVLLDFLDGVIPMQSEMLSTNSNEVDAYLYNGKLFLKTDYTLVSPAWDGKVSSSSGSNAYEIQNISNIIISKNGILQNVEVGS